ncbi:WD40-repeat-containing domain protein, partial [Dipodascopsis tothii]|uniref:WD40-repeat-containing domain protein n=1 Tax=Dipodascopsis tothii TaxID=44089 RepID=UPI0034CD5CAA
MAAAQRTGAAKGGAPKADAEGSGDRTKYTRGSMKPLKVEDKKLRSNLRKQDARFKQAARTAMDTDVLLQEEAGFLEAEGMERTYKFSQAELKDAVDVSTASKGFELALDHFGPYSIDYTRNGRKLLIGGLKGHVAAFDWREGTLDTELNLGETVHAVKYLHDDQYFAAAQKKYVYIYDKAGTELHCLKKHIDVTALEFLPYHFLLATAGNAGWLKYQDTSTGELVAEHRTRLGPTTAMTHNPWNAVVHLGHTNGTVTLWSPSSTTPLVKVLAHKGPVRALAVNREGRYMVTAGADSQLKVWDVRMYREVHAYYSPTPAATLDISDTGLLGVGWGPHVTVWKDALRTKQKSPYMTHLTPGSMVHGLRFAPFEDVLGMGHDRGFSSLIVPGAGEANFDALEVNPYETLQQRREGEVRSLLNKLKPDMIALDPDFIGNVDGRAPAERAAAAPPTPAADIKLQPKIKARGKNSALRRYLRKKAKNVVDDRRLKVEANLAVEKKMRQDRLRQRQGLPAKPDGYGAALARFEGPSKR